MRSLSHSATPNQFTAASTIDADTHTIVTDEAALLEVSQKLPDPGFKQAVFEAIGTNNLTTFHELSKKYENDQLPPWDKLVEGLTCFNTYRQLIRTRVVAARAVELSLLIGTTISDDDIRSAIVPPTHVVRVDDRAILKNPFSDYKTLDIMRLRQGAGDALKRGESIGDMLSHAETQTLIDMGDCALGLLLHTSEMINEQIPEWLKTLIQQLTIYGQQGPNYDVLDSGIASHAYGSRLTRGSQARRSAATSALQFMVEQRSNKTTIALPTSPAGTYVYQPTHTNWYEGTRFQNLPVGRDSATTRRNPRSGNPARRAGVQPAVKRAVVRPTPPPLARESTPAPEGSVTKCVEQQPLIEQLLPLPSKTHLREIGFTGNDSLSYMLARQPSELDDAWSIDEILTVYARLWNLVDTAHDTDDALLKARFNEVCTSVPEILPSIDWLRHNWTTFMQAVEASAHRVADSARRDRVASLIDACLIDEPSELSDVIIQPVVDENKSTPFPLRSRPLEEPEVATEGGVRTVSEFMYHVQNGETDTTVAAYLEKNFLEQPVREALQEVINAIGGILEAKTSRGIKKIQHLRKYKGPVVYELKPIELTGLGQRVTVRRIARLRILFTIDESSENQKGLVKIISVVDRAKLVRVVRGLR